MTEVPEQPSITAASAASHDLLHTLAGVLRGAGYGGAVIDEARRRRWLLPEDDALPSALREHRGPLAVLVRLFALSVSVDRADAAGALAPLSLGDLERAGFLVAGGDGVRATVQIAEHDGRLIAGDARGRGGRDVVGALHESSKLLARLLPPGPHDTMLDLGTGSGVLALTGAPRAKHVVATDVNPRALRLAGLNTRLNGVTNVTLRAGDWFDPVVGERFDLVVCNPPFAISPDDEYTYRDSGLPAGELARRLCREMPDHLGPSGVGVMLGMWRHAASDDCDSVPRSWVADASGCDAIVICLDTTDALGDAVRWNVPRTDGARATVARWARFHAEQETDAISFGAIVLRRSRAPQPWVVTTRATALPGTRASRQVTRMLAGNDLLRDATDLLGQRLAVPDGLRVTQRFDRRGDSWVARSAVVEVAGELGVTAAIDPDALAALFRCDGRTPLRELAGDVDEALIADAARHLLMRGLLYASAATNA